MPQSSFIFRFKQYLDLPPMQYVANWRMYSAQQMLVETDLLIDDVAEKIGYDSTSSLSKAFRRMFKYPPSEYRRLARKPIHQRYHYEH